MIKQLTKLANHLDAKGLRKEADYLDSIIKKIATEGDAQGDVGIGDDVKFELTTLIEAAGLTVNKVGKSAKKEFIVVIPNPPPHSFKEYDWGPQYLTRKEASDVRRNLVNVKIDEKYDGTSILTNDTGQGTFTVHVVPPNGRFSQEGYEADRAGYDRGTAVATPDSSGA